MSFAHHGVARFSSRMENPVWALPQPNGGVLIVGQTPYLQAGAKTRVLLGAWVRTPKSRVIKRNSEIPSI